jgi:2-polyprenyl-6-methoxyphenol hydroxylase-like FAD-dependent oxidoreductase
LAETPDPREALETYGDRRLEPVTAAVNQSRRVALVAHLRAPVTVALRRAALRVTPRAPPSDSSSRCWRASTSTTPTATHHPSTENGHDHDNERTTSTEA